MRFACLLVEHLPVQVERQLDASLGSRPVVILRPWDEHVLDASPEAMAAGVGPGDARRRVEQLCPEAALLPAREELYLARHNALRTVLANYSPAIQTSALGELVVEVGGLARTFPSEKALALQIAAAAQQATGLPAAVGIAANQFTAGCAARQAEAHKGGALAVPAGQERPFLAPLPLTSLPEPPAELLRRLHLFGITTLEGFAALPHPAVVLQFGPGPAGLLHDLARGIDPRPLAPRAPPPLITRRLTLPEPLTDRAQVLAALEYLAGRLAQALERAGYHTLALTLEVHIEGDQAQTKGAPVKPPGSEPDRLRRLAGRLLGQLTLPTAVQALSLTAYPLREWHLGARQLTLLAAPASLKLERLVEVLRTLHARFGELAVRLASLIGPPRPVAIQVQVQPDGTPAGLRWRGWSRRVVGIYESWREQRTWWDQLVVRDYYQVEAAEGLIFTIFHDDQGQWYLDRRRR